MLFAKDMFVDVYINGNRYHYEKLALNKCGQNVSFEYKEVGGSTFTIPYELNLTGEYTNEQLNQLMDEARPSLFSAYNRIVISGYDKYPVQIIVPSVKYELDGNSYTRVYQCIYNDEHPDGELKYNPFMPGEYQSSLDGTTSAAFCFDSQYNNLSLAVGNISVGGNVRNINVDNLYVDSFNITELSPTGISMVKNPYYIYIGKADRNIVTYNIVYDNNYKGPGKSLRKTDTITGYAIDDDIVKVSAFVNLIYLRAGSNAVTGTFPLTATASGFSTEFYVKILNDGEVDDPYVNGGTTGGMDGSSSTGGGGYFGKNPSTGQSETSDPISIPVGSVAGDASATGMMTRYLANSSQLEIFGDWLWTDDLGLAIAKAGISLLYGSPAEAVISLMSYPFDISSLSGVTTRSQNLYWGNHNSGIGATALTSPAATIDWGTISLNEYWGNFLDYEPHTKIELYLPWGTGFVSVDPGQCLPGILRVVTNIDLNKGSCVHNVFGNNGCVIGTYAGQCSQQIPIISNDYASKIAGVVTTATSLAVAGAAGAVGAAKSADRAFDSFVSQNPLGVGGVPGDWMDRLNSTVNQAAVRGFSEGARQPAKLAAASSVAALRRTSNIARNGSFTDGSAALGCQYPYIILSRPSQSVPKEYGSHYGYPSNIYTQLSDLKGYTEVGEIHLNGIDATDPEISELDKILKGGVIF